MGDQLGRALAHKEATSADAEMLLLLLLLLLLASALPAVGSEDKRLFTNLIIRVYNYSTLLAPGAMHPQSTQSAM